MKVVSSATTSLLFFPRFPGEWKERWINKRQVLVLIPYGLIVSQHI